MGGLEEKRSAAAALQPGPAHAEGGIDDGDVGHGMREVPKHPAPWDVIFLGEQSEVVGDGQHTLEEGARFLKPILHRHAIRQESSAQNDVGKR